MKRILITGGCGFVGRHLVQYLAKEPRLEIWIIDDLSTGLPPEQWRVPRLTEIAGGSEGVRRFTIGDTGSVANYLHADFMRVALGELGRVSTDLARLPPFDEIYHLASVVGGRDVIENDPLAVGIDLAIDSAFFLWAAKVARPGRILYASSSAAYPLSLQRDGSAVRLCESMLDFSGDIGVPDYTYGWSKLTGEFLGRIAVAKYGLKVAVVRPFSGYGEDQEPVYPFPAIALRVAARLKPVMVWGTGGQSRDFVHIDDAVVACVLACRNVEDGTAFNIGSGAPTTFLELAREMIRIEGYEAEVVGKSGKPVGAAHRYCDPALIKATLGWTQTISLQEGIARALDVARERLAAGVQPEV